MKPVVIKRDGCRVPFECHRIEEAVLSAAQAVEDMDRAYAAAVADGVLSQFMRHDEVDIHQIQDAVENHLMAGPYKAVARAYIEYRHDRDSIRENKAV